MNIFKKSFKLILLIIVFLSFSQTASAATLTGGNTVISRPEPGSRTDFTLVDQNHPISNNGKVSQVSFYTINANKVQLKIIRKTGVDYTVIGQSGLMTPNIINGVNTFIVDPPISTNKGDLVGFYFETTPSIPFTLDNPPYLRGDLLGIVLFTNSGENPQPGEIVGFDDSSSRTYSISVSGTAEYRVDEDMIDCPTADYDKIQKAVNNLPAGETIYVCKGTYKEAIKINKKDLTIVSTDGANVTTVKAKSSDSTKFAFRLQKSGITIKGFTITDADGPVGASAIVIEANNATINNNIFDNNNYGIYSSGSNNTKITGNVFQKGVNIGGVGAVISLVGSANEISGNQFQDNDTEGVVLGSLAVISKNNNINNNSIVGSGIVLIKSNSNNIASNLIKNSISDGILLSQTSGQNTVKTNSISGAKRDGIRAEADTQKNTIQNNMIKNNSAYDAHDLTSNKKAKVKNTWKFNMCSTSSPSGLCF